MKTVFFAIIIILIFMSLYLKPAHADNENDITVQDIQTLPTAIIIGQTFKINATLINNSPNPIFIEHGSCGSPFSVTFDNHVVVRTNNVTCTLQLIEQRLDPGTKITSTSPYLDLTYMAAQNGTVNATVSFPYNFWNQTSQSNTKENITKPFSFTIYPKTRVPTLTPSGNQALIDVALSIPGLQKWSNDWQFVSMGFMTAKNQPGNWQYATVNLKASSSSSLIPCDNNNEDWSAMVVIDRTTMKVVQATYPTLESHNCNYTTGGGPTSYGGTIPMIDTPLKQFKSGIAAKDVKCKEGLQFIMKKENGQPACVTPHAFDELIIRGWGIMPLGGLPTYNNTSNDIAISYNYTLYVDGSFHVKQGQNFTLMLDVTSDPANIPVTLYTAPHSGFTKTNGIDFKLSDTVVNTPAKVMLYMSVSKDATPSTYGEAVRLNDTDLGSVTYLFYVTVK